MKEITNQLESIEEVLQLLVNKIKSLEEKQPDLSAIKIPDHNDELKTINQVLITINQVIANHNSLYKEVKTLIQKTNTKLGEPVKPHIRQYRFLLFPETNSGYYYKIVFGRLIPWALFFIVIICLFSFGEKSIAAWQAYRYNQQTEQCVRAWLYLNDHGNKQVKKAMDQAWLKSGTK